MQHSLRGALAVGCIVLAAFIAAPAAAVPITFVKLAGLTGGSPAHTAIYRADLSSISFDILSISISDNSFGIGGANGKFSGFDLDAIKLSSTFATSASDAAALMGLGVFDFSAAGALFTPGAQRAPVDPKLFGTNAAGTGVNNAVATPGLFDANSTTGSGAFGFLSLGDGGRISFNLSSAVSSLGGLYLYIGEVGDNGEFAAGRIEVSDKPVPVPEPASLILVGLGLLGLTGVRRKQKA